MLFFRGGKKEGTHLYLYRGGLPKSIINYKDGELDGEVVLYHPDGQLKHTLHFQMGKRHGREEIWDLRRTKRIEAQFDVGKPVGRACIWHYNGVLAKEILYDQNSNCLSTKQWDDQGHEIAITGNEDYFVRASQQAEKLTHTLNKMVRKVAHSLPLIIPQMRGGQTSEDLFTQLETLHQETENLEQLGKQLKESAEGETEKIWKSKKMQHEMEKQIENMTGEMQKNIAHLGEALKELTKYLKKHD